MTNCSINGIRGRGGVAHMYYFEEVITVYYIAVVKKNMRIESNVKR